MFFNFLSTYRYFIFSLIYPSPWIYNSSLAHNSSIFNLPTRNSLITTKPYKFSSISLLLFSKSQFAHLILDIIIASLIDKISFLSWLESYFANNIKGWENRDKKPYACNWISLWNLWKPGRNMLKNFKEKLLRKNGNEWLE